MEDIQKLKMDIVRESITQILCIDDEIVMPYGAQSDIHFAWSRDLYDDLTKKCNCVVDILQYKKSEYEQCIEKFMNKDLLLIDWEMSSHGEKYSETLRLIEEAVKSDIPFICIYTKTPNRDEIYSCIKYYFSGYSNETVAGTEDKWKRIIVGNKFYELLDEYFSVEHIDKGLQKKIRQKMLESIEDDERAELKKNGIEYITDKELFSLFLDIKKYILPDGKTEEAKWIGKGKALDVNGKLVICFHKNLNSISNEFVVSPENIVKKISEYLSEEPKNIFNIIWLKFKNHFNHLLYKQGSFFQEIDEKAFYHYVQQLLRDGGKEKLEEAFSGVIKDMYRDEIISKLNNDHAGIGLCILEEIYNYGEEKIKNLNNNKLVELNYFFSVNKDKENKKISKIQFGNVFHVEDAIAQNSTQKFDFLLCVTPHCDCLRPQKIKHNYFFVSGKKVDDKTALENAEKGYYSFLKYNNRYISIEWNERLFSIYCPQDSANGEDSDNKIKAYFSNEEFIMNYVCSLKENYTQRFANAAYSFGNRVGISYAKLDTEEEMTEKVSSEAAVTKEEI